MRDTYGRQIDYLRISLTDRCNFRCHYCLPDGCFDVGHAAVLRYEEIERIVASAVHIGIRKFKITGGEPLVRKGAVPFMGRLKSLPGVEQVTLTTNGYALLPHLPYLANIGIDSINISLDSTDREQFQRITKVDGLLQTMAAIRESVRLGIHTKINAVLLDETKEQLLPLARLAEEMPVDVRFIELMPIGFGVTCHGETEDAVLPLLRSLWPDLQRVAYRGNGPAVYYTSKALQGHIGFIAANSHQFCETCNRLRLTSTGFLKSCLCYDVGIDLNPIVRHDNSIQKLEAAFAKAIAIKPKAHCFAKRSEITEQKGMNQIGG